MMVLQHPVPGAIVGGLVAALMPTLTNSEKRVARIKLLAGELQQKCAVNDETTRARCRAIALDIAGLIQAEDAFQRAIQLVEESRAICREAEAARLACAEARERVALERLLS